MCCSINSKSIIDWFNQPINCSKEKYRILVITTIALLAIGLAIYTYISGTADVRLRQISYCLWGLAGGAILCTLVAYIAKDILSSRPDPYEPPKEKTRFERYRDMANRDGVLAAIMRPRSVLKG